MDRVVARLDRLGVVEGLGQLSGSDLRTLLLAVFRQRAARPLRAIAEQHQRMAATWAGPLDARENHALADAFWRAVPPDVVGCTLPPVVPLGTHHALAGTPQDNVLSASRALESIGDPTVALCLEAARRRREQPVVRLAAVGRALRMQPLRASHHTQHFQLAALVDSARGRPGLEAELVGRHLQIHLDALRTLRARFALGAVRVALTDTALVRHTATQLGVDLTTTRWTDAQPLLDAAGVPRFVDELGDDRPVQGTIDRQRALAERVRERLGDHPDVVIGFDPGRTRQAMYFDGPAFHIQVEHGGSWVPVVDGGFVDWVARLRNDRRERTLTSGAGIEMLARIWTPVPADGSGSTGGLETKAG
jgi:hypothetical protein